MTKYRSTDGLSICSICVEQKQKLRAGTGGEVQVGASQLSTLKRKTKTRISWTPRRMRESLVNLLREVSVSSYLETAPNVWSGNLFQFSVWFRKRIQTTPWWHGQYHYSRSAISRFYPIQPPRAAGDPTSRIECITSAHSTDVDDWFDKFMTNDGCWVYEAKLLLG